MAFTIAMLQSSPEYPQITDIVGKIAAITITASSGVQRDLCVTLPDGRARLSGTDSYHYYANRISVNVFAKRHSDAAWGKACSIGNDAMLCANVKGAYFLGSNFDLLPYDGYSRSVCWSFINRSGALVDAKLVAHYTLREVKNGFVLYSRKPGDRTPMAMTVGADCFCVSDSLTVTAYFARELKPSLGFFARRGDVIEIKALGKGQQFGIPDGCTRELTQGTYHLKIQHIYAFEQPAVYKSITQGLITSEPLTDVANIFTRP
jgi:hypothetical protein